MIVLFNQSIVLRKNGVNVRWFGGCNCSRWFEWFYGECVNFKMINNRSLNWNIFYFCNRRHFRCNCFVEEITCKIWRLGFRHHMRCEITCNTSNHIVYQFLVCISCNTSLYKNRYTRYRHCCQIWFNKSCYMQFKKC